ncbi:MAG: Flagellar P-ring protein precursor [Syntrophorhabdus sp. PtaU1.Bin058]|nr:MAG: Flagellar P-ring protein precursor [Syntrophorhabdus sp. PtaU1.Bin058]
MKKIAEATEYLICRRKKESIVYFLLFFACCMVVFFIISARNAGAARIKELGNINGVRSNQLIGYGLVVGLNGTGDKSNTLFTFQSLANLLDRMGVKVDPRSTKVNNVAAVMVTADLPPFAKTGNRIDAVISSIGDAKSIEGGVLLLTQLKGADGEVYGIAQGSIVVGGFLAGGTGASIQKNHPTVGRIVNGVSIEKEVPYEHLKTETVVVSLKMPDFTNARKIVDRINEVFAGSAYAKDGGTINVTIPDALKHNPVKFLAMLEGLEIKPDNIAKIVVDEKTGTVVIGENVRISTVAISHGNISVQIKEDQKVSQPMPFSGGTTVTTPDTQMKVEEEKGHFLVMEGGISIRELVNALNAIGVSTRDVITILQTIKAAGALHADLEVI